MTRARLFMVVVALAGLGCTLLTPFDPNSQPCEANAAPGSECTAGYQCQRDGEGDPGVCVAVDGGN